MNQQQGTKGKHYYLALDANLRQEKTDSKIHESFNDLAPPAKQGGTRVYTYVTDVDKTDATAEVYLLTDDEIMSYITVTYKIIPYKVFDRFFSMGVESSETRPWDPSNTPNPYLKGTTTRHSYQSATVVVSLEQFSSLLMQVASTTSCSINVRWTL